MPVAIMVEFDHYTGPCLPGTNMFPVTALTRTFMQMNGLFADSVAISLGLGYYLT